MANLRKLGRRADHRDAMLRNQVQSLIENGKIETTFISYSKKLLHFIKKEMVDIQEY